MTSWYQAIDRLFVQPERLAWLWLVAASILGIIIGELLRARWRRRLFALGRDRRAERFGNRWRWILSGARIIALLLIVLALADPRAGLGSIEVKTSKLQIVCLLDRSRSMMAQDAAPRRFEAAANVVREVVDSAGGAAVALATFAGDARIDMPLTRDYEGSLVRLDEVTPDYSQAAGTNLSAGLATAAACFAERIEAPKILIVITDGETHGIEPELLNRLAEALDGSFRRIGTDASTTAIIDAVRRAESNSSEDLRLAYRRQTAPWFHWLLLAAVCFPTDCARIEPTLQSRCRSIPSRPVE